jgi:outer membrane lipoprotein carrier protein
MNKRAIKKRVIQVGLAVGLGWAAAGLCAVDPLTLVQMKLSAIQTLDAQFMQTVATKRGVASRTKGRLALSRPGRFRWQTQLPTEQIVVADGEHVWIYDKDLEQVAVKKQTQTLGAAGALFLSQSTQAIGRDFRVTYSQKDATETFVLESKSSKANFERVILVFHNQLLQSIALDDQLGQHTTVKFKQVRINQSEPASLFTLKVPAGVDVIRQ